MREKSVLQTIVATFFVAVVVVIVLSQIVGYPPLVGFVETGSMEPTLETGEGFVAVPAPVAGDIEEGDIVTFEAQTVGDGGLTTHRVVDETSNGYITRGDANQFDDQEAGEPPVQESQIVAVAVQVNGEAVSIPYVGSVTSTVQGAVGSAFDGFGMASTDVGTTTTIVGLVLVAASLGYGLVSSSGRSVDRSPSRSVLLHSGWILLVLVLVVALPIVTSMYLPSGTDDVRITSVSDPDDSSPTRIQAGETESIRYEAQNRQVVPKLIVLEPKSDGVAVSEPVLDVSHGETVETDVELTAPDETGPVVRSRGEYHYHHVLPTRVIVALHEIHPTVAMGGISLVFVVPVVLAFTLLVGFRPISVRPVHD